MRSGLVVLLLFSYLKVHVCATAHDIDIVPSGQVDKACLNVCMMKDCPAQRGATCKVMHHDCVAHFYDKYGNDVTENCQCPTNVTPYPCKSDPCDYAECSKRGQCRTDACGGCEPVFYDRDAKPIIDCPDDPNKGICPPLPSGPRGDCAQFCGGECPRNQLCCSNGCGHVCKDPYYPDCPRGGQIACKPGGCYKAKCPGQMEAVCIPKCFGCIPFFYDKFDNDVTDKCECPKGVKSKMCKVDPCKDKTCPNHPEAECRGSTCGTCKANFYDKSGRKVQCKKNVFDTRCPLFVRSTFETTCSSNSDCRSDYMCCGRLGGSYCTSKRISCEPGEYLARCWNQCRFSKCREHPRARCRVHGCNGCRLEFYDGSTNMLYKDCTVIDS